MRLLLATIVYCGLVVGHLLTKHNQLSHGRKGGGTSSKGRKITKATNKIGADRIGTPAQRLKIANRLLDDAKRAEPQITSDLSDLADSNGGKMEGLQHRFKKPENIAGKIERVAQKPSRDWAKSPDDLASTLADNLRYTFLSADHENHAGDVGSVLDGLKERGYQFEDSDVENNWLSPGAYKGINMNLKDPDGYKFELQFHSPDSIDLKGQIHGLYEAWRAPGTSEARRAQLAQEMERLASGLGDPPGIEGIGVPA